MKRFAILLGLMTSVNVLAVQPAPVLQPIMPQGKTYSPPPVDPAKNPYFQGQSGWITPTQTPYGPIFTQQATMPAYRDYQMNRVISPEEKKRYLQMAMPMMANMMQLDAREAMNYMTVKYKAKPGLKFDEVVESLKLRGNQVNFKLVGENLMWKDFKAVLNDDTAPRVEVFSFCDIAVGRQLLKLIPEMAVYLPCRITVMEDADKNIWVMTQDWDAAWLDYSGKSMGIPPELKKAAAEIRDKMDNMMRAAANGDI